WSETTAAAMELLGGSSPVRCGKWVKADWLISGQFSLDDRNQRTLFLEVTDLQHADVLDSQTLIFPGAGTTQIQPDKVQVDLAAKVLRQLLSNARSRCQQASEQTSIAALFLADVTDSGFTHGTEALQQGFYEALERAAATNHRVRLIRFPKAYQSMEESEMILDGLVEAD